MTNGSVQEVVKAIKWQESFESQQGARERSPRLRVGQTQSRVSTGALEEDERQEGV